MNKTKLNEFMSFRRGPYSHAKSHRYGDFFGIELELEDIDYDRVENIIWAHWSIHGDGSLQANGREFVLAGPRGGNQLIAALDEFYQADIQATNGLRTSTHIHINASDLSVGELRTMLVVSYTVEAALFRWIGENRKWCGYAMPLTEMPSARLRNLLTASRLRSMLQSITPSRNNDRYYGVNVGSIAKHGTVEYRHFPGKPTRAELEEWLDFVRAMKTAGQTLPFPELGERIESEPQLREFLASVIPANVWDRLLSVEIAGEFWQAFNEIMALSEPSEDIERIDKLVFMKPQLLRYFVKSKTLTPYQADQLGKLMAKVQVLTVRDFHAQLRNIKALRPDGQTEEMNEPDNDPQAEYPRFVQRDVYPNGFSPELFDRLLTGEQARETVRTYLASTGQRVTVTPSPETAEPTIESWDPDYDEED